MKRWLALLLLAVPCAAQTYQRMDFSLQNAMGQAISGATVTVFSQATTYNANGCGGASTGTAVNIYPNSQGGTPVQTLTTDGYGHASGYVPLACYTVQYFSPFSGTQTFVDQSPQNALPGGTGCTVSGSANQLVTNSGSSGCGSSAATADSSGNVVSASLTSGAVNSVLMAGTTQYPTIASAIAALPSTGGTVQTPPNYSETLTTLALGSSTQPVTLLMGQSSKITVTDPAGVLVYNGSAVICMGSAGTSCTLKSSQTGSPVSLLTNGNHTSQEYFYVSGVTFDCGAKVFSSGCVDVQNVYAPSAFVNNVIYDFGATIGLHVESSTAGSGGLNKFLISNNWVNGQNIAGARPFVVDRSGTGSVTSLGINDNTFENPGPNQHTVEVNGNGSGYQMAGIAFGGLTQIQGNASGTVAPVFYEDVQNLTVENMKFAFSTPNQPQIEITQSAANLTGNVLIHSAYGGSSASTIKNDIDGYESPYGIYQSAPYWFQGQSTVVPLTMDGQTNFIYPVNSASTAYSPASTRGTNYLVTASVAPSFETGSSTTGTGWSTNAVSDPSAVFLRDGTNAAPNLGSYSQKITVGTSAGRDMIYVTNAGWSVTAGSLYGFTFWLQNDGSGLQAEADVADVTEGTQYCALQTFQMTTTWTQEKITCTASSSASGIYLRISNLPSTGTGSFWIDGVDFFAYSTLPYLGFGSLAQASADGTTLTQSAGNVLSCTTATSSQIGCARPDNSTITVSGGVLSSTASAFSGGLGTSYQDVTETAAPANPSAGNDRLYTDSSTHLLTCLTSSGGSCMPSTGSGANTALSNLSAVSINTALLFQTGLDVGSTTKPLRNLYFYGGGTYGTNYFEQTGTPTAARTITWPDASDTVVELTQTQTLTNKTLDGVTPTTMAYVDPTSSIQTQLNGKASSSAATTPNGQTCTLGSTCNVNSGAAAHSVALNEGSGAAIGGASIGTSGRLLIDQGAAADPSFNAMSGDCTITNTGAITCTKTSGTAFSALATTTPGTGVATALGVNTGSAGAFVVNGGALGTPSSGTGTNITGIPGGNLTSNSVTATQLAAQYSKGSCTELWGGSGTSFALTSGDDAIANNSCYNDSGVTRTITAVKCRSDNASNTTTVNPTFGSAGTGTTILSGALTCGNSYAYSSSGTVSNASWTTGTGIDPAMSGTLTGTSIAMIVEYTY